MPSDEIARWADVAMWEAEPSDTEPSATVVSMTPRPAQVIGATCEMYIGHTIRDPADVDQATALKWLGEINKTVLKAPFEFVDIHLLLEGVPRDFTHQLVRQRTAVYAQESMRFAVKTGAAGEVAAPPSIAPLPADDPRRLTWDSTIDQIAWAYNSLVNDGIPAEDARKLLPHGIVTRVHYKSNLRNLQSESGKRLCSQAQFDWKKVWVEIVRAIQEYGPLEQRWQQEAISRLFAPVCYLTGKCEFMSSVDRACSIRDRVEAHHRKGEPPDTWSDINQFEPLVDGAARKAPGDK